MISGTFTGIVAEGDVGDAPVTASGTISISDVDDADNPINVVRIVRSFDPCLACAVHLTKPNGDIKKFRVC